VRRRGPVKENKGAVTMKGNPLTLVGRIPELGNKAPEFTVTGNDMAPFSFSACRGKVCIICSVPSLDTPVCDLETRRFNQEVTAMGGVALLTVSMDLPFAQKRWCGATGATTAVTLSDHKDASFGTAYGVLIKELRLLARAVFVVDRQGIVRYVELVKDIGDEPDYRAALRAAKEAG
jgi:thiol peroxidase